MTTHFIGQILEVRATERKDKKTGQMIYETEVTVMFDGYDEQGHRVPSIERSNVSQHWFDLLAAAKGKYVAIPYRTINTQSGTYTFVDSSIPPVIMDANPLDYSQYAPKAQEKSAAGKR